MDNVLTNVQKVKLNNIAIPGNEGAFKGDIHAIVNFDTKTIYRYLPERKAFTSNQDVIARFGQATDPLDLDFATLDAKLMKGGAQMYNTFISRALIDSEAHYNLRCTVWNAYDKGTGHLLTPYLTWGYELPGITNNFGTAYWPLKEEMLTDLSVIETRELIQTKLTAALKLTHYLEWLQQQTINGSGHQFFAPFVNTLPTRPQRQMYWNLNQQNASAFLGLSRLSGVVFGRHGLLDTSASPLEHSRRARAKKFSDLWEPFDHAVMQPFNQQRGYVYEDPDNNEQNSPDDGGDTDIVAVAGDPDTQRGDDTPIVVPDNLAG